MPKNTLNTFLLVTILLISLATMAFYIAAAVARSSSSNDLKHVGWFVYKLYPTQDDFTEIHLLLGLHGFYLSDSGYTSYSQTSADFGSKCSLTGKRSFDLVIVGLSLAFLTIISTAVRLVQDSLPLYILNAFMTLITALFGFTALGYFDTHCVGYIEQYLDDSFNNFNYSIFLFGGGVSLAIGFSLMAFAFVLNFFVPITDEGFKSVEQGTAVNV